VARLVVDRKTNPEIAAELFLSQKTVETHLHNIFRKIDVSTRIELARVVEHTDRSARATSRSARLATVNLDQGLFTQAGSLECATEGIRVYSVHPAP
jgi:hypothetical protein